MRILIVDDDVLVRKWLTMLLTQIPQRDICVEESENGLAALRLMQSGSPPDLLITDIKMPQMDGLTLCQHVKQGFPQLPVVILSSYEEFPFVKKALQLGALDYILKADMSMEDMIAVIEKAENARENRGRRNLVKERQQMLNAFLESAGGEERTFLLRLHPKLTLETLVITMFRTSQILDERFVENFFGQAEFAGAAIIPSGGQVYTAFLHTEDTQIQGKKAAAHHFLNLVRRQDASFIESWATVLNCDEDGVYAGIQTCRSVLEYKYYYGLEDFLQVPYHKMGEFSPISHMPAYQKFFEVVNHYQARQAAGLLWTCLEAFHQMYYHPADIGKYISLMCHKLLADVSVLEIEIEWFNQTLQRLHDAASATTRHDRQLAVKEFIAQYKNVFPLIKEKHSDTILQALAYIDVHYAEKVTLEQVSAHVYMNSTYMSELFKKEMGVTFNDYVNNLRIIHACEHLRFTALSMSEIAERCGFTDQNYFTKVFKKYIGSTPSQYRAHAANAALSPSYPGNGG